MATRHAAHLKARYAFAALLKAAGLPVDVHRTIGSFAGTGWDMVVEPLGLRLDVVASALSDKARLAWLRILREETDEHLFPAVATYRNVGGQRVAVVEMRAEQFAALMGRSYTWMVEAGRVKGDG
jgi:hypothetical protein